MTLKSLHSTFSAFLLILLLINCSHAGRYFLCGPDEDGCASDIYAYCSCIPVNEMKYTEPFCLDFEQMTCIPASESPKCHPSFIYNNQAECLATVFHSIPNPPCTITTYTFCQENKSYFCDATGDPATCHK